MNLSPADSLLSAIVHSAPTGIVATDAKGEITLVNRLALDLFGYNEGEMIGSEIEALIPERYRGGHLQLRNGFAKSDEAPRPMGSGRDLFALRKDGSEFPVEIGLAQFDSEGGKIVVASIVDIQRRKETEHRLELQAQVLANVHDAVLMISPEGEIRTWNEGAHSIFGYDAVEMVGQPCSRLSPQEEKDRFKRVVLPKVLADGAAEFGFDCLHANGKTISVSLRATRLGSAENLVGVVVCASDITARKELEQKLLEVSEAEQRRIGQDIHDDLCQQLASIGCLTKVLEQQLKSVYEDGAENLARIGDMISQANVRAREIARGLAPSMLQSEGLSGVLRDLAVRTQKSYQVRCVAHCPDSISVVDPQITTHLYRIAQEAVGNAVRHAEPTLVEITLRENPGSLSISVIDDGVGITEPTQSTGMGLLTMAHRAQLLGGEFDLHSSPGGGTRIQIEVKTK